MPFANPTTDLTMKYPSIHPNASTSSRRFPAYQLWFTNEDETRVFPVACLYSTIINRRGNSLIFVFTRVAVAIVGCELRELLLAVDAGDVSEIAVVPALAPAPTIPPPHPWRIQSIGFAPRGER